MTNIDINGIMGSLNISMSKKEGSIKITMEVNADNLEEAIIPYCKQNIACEKEKRMTNLHVNLKGITCCLIQFFYKTARKYSCTQTKLGKLLSILAFKYAINNELLFDEPIYKYSPQCGTLIKALTFIPKDIYIRDLDEPDYDVSTTIDDICDDNICDEVVIPMQYIMVEDISLSLKENIEDVFKNFGAYSGDELSKHLNPIVDKIVNETSGEIDLSLIHTLNLNDFDSNCYNSNIIKYLYK